jgi:hypothetical protein
MVGVKAPLLSRGAAVGSTVKRRPPVTVVLVVLEVGIRPVSGSSFNGERHERRERSYYAGENTRSRGIFVVKCVAYAR